MITPKKPEPPTDIGELLERKVSTGSKVIWGGHDTYAYEVQAPEYERSDYMPHEDRQDLAREVAAPVKDSEEERAFGRQAQPRPYVSTGIGSST
jgi:hypothetical protein